MERRKRRIMKGEMEGRKKMEWGWERGWKKEEGNAKEIEKRG